MSKRVTGDRWQVTGRRVFWGTRHLPLLLTCHLFLAACSFQPLHSKAYQDSLPVDLSSVSIEVGDANNTNEISFTTSSIARRYSELLKAEIIDKTYLSHGVPKRFRFVIGLNESQSSQFVNPDGTSSRGELSYNSTYKVIRLSDMKQIASGSIARTSSYNTAPNADYTSYVSLEDARRRAILELAQSYKLRLAELVPVLADPRAGENPDPDSGKPIPVLQPAPSYETLRSRN